MFTVNKVDSFPEITRNGRVSHELQMIIDTLNESAKSGDKFCIDGIVKGKQYNSMQQRIRAQAKKLNLDVIIRHDSSESKLYFKAIAKPSNNENTTVKASEVTNVKTNAKVSK
jgi:hypothetical protein